MNAQREHAGRFLSSTSAPYFAVAQGFEVQREPVGKRITARIALPDDLGGDAAPNSRQRSLGPAVVPDGLPWKRRAAGGRRRKAGGRGGELVPVTYS
jgi:hypothetical protein